MKINEIKKTQEIVVRTEYVADDGTVFYDESECRKYEESALFAISRELKRLSNSLRHCDINDDLSEDCEVEIFDIQTDKDLENLKRYLYLKAQKNGASEADIKECFTSENGKRNDYVFDSVTIGHEVIIFWDYEQIWFWVYKDGSINGYVEFFREKITKLITSNKEENKNA